MRTAGSPPIPVNDKASRFSLWLNHSPRLLILDEPTLALDVTSRHRIWAYLLRLRDKGTATLLAINYMDEAEYLCDEVCIINGGQQVDQEGRPPADQVRADPAGRQLGQVRQVRQLAQHDPDRIGRPSRTSIPRRSPCRPPTASGPSGHRTEGGASRTERERVTQTQARRRVSAAEGHRNHVDTAQTAAYCHQTYDQ